MSDVISGSYRWLSIIVVLVFMFTLGGVALAANLPFDDVTEGEAHSDAVSLLYETGITQGVSPTEFGEDLTVTRQQFATFVVRALDREAEATELADEVSEFEDDEEIASWARGSAALASELGIVQGYPDGTFRPKNPVTHAEMLTMLIRVLDVSEAAVGEWPDNFLTLADELGLKEGIPNVAADSRATRAEMALALSNGLLCRTRGWDAHAGQMTRGKALLEENFPAVYARWADEVLELLYTEDRWEQVDDVAYSPDGDTVGVGAEELALFSVSDREVLVEGGDLPEGERPESKNLHFAPDDSFLATAWRGVSLRNVDDLSEIVEIHGGNECRIAVSSDGETLATHRGQMDGEVWLWRSDNGSDFTRIAELNPDAGWIHDIEFTPDGAYLAGGFRDGKVVLWDVDTQQVHLTLDFENTGGNYNLAFQPTGDLLAASDPDLANEIYVFDLDDGTRQRTLDPGEGRVFSMQFSPDGTRLAYGTTAGEVIILDTADWSEVHSFEHEGTIEALAFAPDGRKLVAGSSTGQLHVYGYVAR